MKGGNATRFLTVIGHVNELSNRFPPLPRNACANDTAVLINGFRSCSLSFFVRKQWGRHWESDMTALDEVIGIVDWLARKKFPELWKTRDTDRNPDYGICIFHNRRSQKSLARASLRRFFGQVAIYMIGNSMSDYMHNPWIKHCAVANASPEFKAKCGDLVAAKPRTAGVIELLHRIVP